MVERASSGKGHQIDIAMVDSMTRFMSPRIVPYLGSGEIPHRSGARDSVIAVYQAFETQDKPLTLAASICFEQSYSGVDGDSASSTEVYALVSALSDLPLRQDIAVTGSMNQRGDIQAIGGVNEKIEGFFDTCRIYGLTGTQGVLMPASNVEDLMLREDVLEAVTAGKFHVWPVSRIEQGIELLTGTKAGGLDAAGKFAEGTVFARVDARLREMAKMMKEFE